MQSSVEGLCKYAELLRFVLFEARFKLSHFEEMLYEILVCFYSCANFSFLSCLT
jgi:hypothetical protein